MAGVAFNTAALIIVLSVFNGLIDLLRSLNNAFDPDIRIEATRSKSFEVSDEMLQKLQGIPGVKAVTEVIEDYAYISYRDANQVVIVKGVSQNFVDEGRIPEENIVEGELKLRENGINYAVIGRGVQYTLSVAVSDPLYPLQVYYIKDLRGTVTDPSRVYSRKSITPGGVFSIFQNFDENYMVVPLEFMQELLQYGNRRTSLEIKTEPQADIYEVEENIQSMLGNDFNVLNHEEQHRDLYQLVKMEKLFTFLALALLLTVGSINIFFSLMMLALDKKKDISILSAMGAGTRQIRNIFLAEGALIAFSGALAGLVLGGLFCWLQVEYGLISMGMEAAVVQHYPVKVKIGDFFIILLVVSIITFLISAHPAKKASEFAAARYL